MMCVSVGLQGAMTQEHKFSFSYMNLNELELHRKESLTLLTQKETSPQGSQKWNHRGRLVRPVFPGECVDWLVIYAVTVPKLIILTNT